ncbi:ABC transporter permease [Romboutsia sp.]|uniref:ABC transporter permease n=1 Tax=Romboutsia sp. TaxID=1965302 RepID=UPI003F407318
MDIISLVIASALLVIPIFISYKEKLELEKEIVVSMLRAIIQLVLVGYILDFVFGLENYVFTTILVLIMIFNGALNTKKRGEGIKNVVGISFIALIIGTSITITVLVISGAIKFVPNEVIPVAGMVVSNSMVAIGLSYRNLNTSFRSRRSEVEVKLSLGSDIKNASKTIIRESIKVSIMPSIDSAKTLGIVSLPGMMTGLILGGASPLLAIKFQIMVTFMILSSTSISSIIATYISYKHFFNERKQLNV